MNVSSSDGAPKAAGGEPVKPAGVPPEAWWSPEDDEWMTSARDADGKLHGAATYWRPDGTLVSKSFHEHGVVVGLATRFHQSGEVSQTAYYEAGVLHGTRTWFATDTETTEQFRAPGMHESIWRTEMDYERGAVVRIRHFDREGRRVLPGDGSPYPTPPEGVPADAEYHVDEEYWTLGRADGETKKKHGLWRCWTKAGVPLRDIEYEDDARHGVFRRYDERGELILELTYASGKRQGPAKVRVTGAYPELGGDWLAGAYEGGVPVGTWSLTDERRGVVKTIALGPLLASAAASLALDETPRSPETLRALAETFATWGKGFEAVCALARLAAQTEDGGVLERALAERALPFSEEVAARLATDDEDQDIDGIAPKVGDLLLGLAEPGDVLEAIGDILHQDARLRAALDVIGATLLLEPERWGCIFTRVLVWLGLGDLAKAEEDCAKLAETDEDAADYLRALARVAFTTFDFWAGKKRPKTTYSGLPRGPEQSLEAIQKMVAKYARRLTVLREALSAKVPGNAWLPDVSHLVRADVTLDKYSFSQTDEDGDQVSVDVDETIDTATLDVLDLMQAARRDWNALTYLCWSAGLDDVAMPETLAPPRAYGKAAGMSAERLWRARDLRAMNGMGARMTGAPSFTWEDMDLEEMDRRLVIMVEREYAELAALFRWLTDEGQRSVWQDNLRYSGKAMPPSRRSQEGEDDEEDGDEEELDDTPDRPASVAAEARWNDEDDTWVLAAPENERGRPHGTTKVWREDGSLRQEEHLDDGRTTYMKMLHPDGTVAVERTFDPVTFALATVTRRAPKGKSDVPFPRGGMDPRVVEARYVYDAHGYMTEFVGYDEAGAEVTREEVNRSLDNRVPQTDYASVEEASREWNEKNRAYYAALNDFIAKLNGHDTEGEDDEADEEDESEDDDEPEEPTDERGHMERYVLRTLEALNKAGKAAEARRLFAPSFEPFSEALWQAHGKTIRKVAALPDGLLVNADDEVFAVRGETIEKVPGAFRFGVSRSKRVVASCYPDRVEVWEVGTGRTLHRYEYPKAYHTMEGVAPEALSLEAFRSPYHLGIEHVKVSDAGDLVVLATTSGMFLLRKERAPRLVLPPDGAIAHMVENEAGDEPYRIAIERPEAELGAGDKALVMSFQLGDFKPFRVAFTIDDNLGATPTTNDEHDEPFGPSLFHSNGQHYLLSLPVEDDETGVFTLSRDYVDAQDESLLGAYEGNYSVRTADLRAVCELGDEFLIGMSDCYLWRQAIDENTQDFAYVGVGKVGQTITSIDTTPDQKEILVGTSYGAVWRLALADERGEGFATNMKLVDRRRYLFLRTFDPMIW